MEKLSLHLNLLTSFPLSLLSFHKLRYLNLSHNSIAGPIPKAIGRLTGLGALILAYNRITSFPTSVAKMTSLHDLYLEGNPTLLYMPAEIMLRARADPGFLLKWNSAKDSMLTEEKQAQIERCEPVAVPTLLNLACCAVLGETTEIKYNSYLKTSRTVVVIRRVNLAPRQKQNRRAAGYWGGEPTATPCLFTFDRLGCYNAWHDADDPDVVKGVRKEAVLDPAAFT
ncbi:leucine rich repeat domain containing protein [Acanthamoeba castellanii str. Neff]|uniref:Leucine rich repeat domain containing protein n=1 Tax=Acanthamoeba castellanii (strain ATCC 30010 / Neff) TaxID=1257118 RepID=L8HG49_ACACF|nr:leucine rich repeat domain containing protein [Acanthamoeba castellanii str. Neff]ELR24232.1 leucine rich repeat domain containing protein [Acanthamoeba castellanii str. Neff]